MHNIINLKKVILLLAREYSFELVLRSRQHNLSAKLLEFHLSPASTFVGQVPDSNEVLFFEMRRLVDFDCIVSKFFVLCFASLWFTLS